MIRIKNLSVALEVWMAVYESRKGEPIDFTPIIKREGDLPVVADMVTLNDLNHEGLCKVVTVLCGENSAAVGLAQDLLARYVETVTCNLAVTNKALYEAYPFNHGKRSEFEEQKRRGDMLYNMERVNWVPRTQLATSDVRRFFQSWLEEADKQAPSELVTKMELHQGVGQWLQDNTDFGSTSMRSVYAQQVIAVLNKSYPPFGYGLYASNYLTRERHNAVKKWSQFV